MGTGTQHPLWPTLDKKQRAFNTLLGRIASNLDNYNELDTVRQWIGEARLIAAECKEVALQILTMPVDGFTLTYGNAKIPQTQDGEIALYNERIRTLDGYAKEESLRRVRTLPRVPWGGLKAHETPDKEHHLIWKHVEQAREVLESRLASQPGIPAASSFTNFHTAEWAVADLLAANHEAISYWLTNTSKPREWFFHEYHREVGHSLLRGQSSPTPTKKLQVRLIRDTNSLSGFRIVTGFPFV